MLPKDACIPIPEPVNMLLYLAEGLHRVITVWILRGKMTLAYMGAGWANVIPKVLARGMQSSQNQTAI